MPPSPDAVIIARFQQRFQAEVDEHHLVRDLPTHPDYAPMIAANTALQQIHLPPSHQECRDLLNAVKIWEDELRTRPPWIVRVLGFGRSYLQEVQDATSRICPL